MYTEINCCHYKMQQQFAKTVYQKYQKRCFVLNKEIQKHIIN